MEVGRNVETGKAVIVGKAYPDRPVLTIQHAGQCWGCKARVWRVLLGPDAGGKRLWVPVEIEYDGVLHLCTQSAASEATA